jgi:hypothetical protein
VRECYAPDGMLPDAAVRTAWDVAARLGLAPMQGPDAAEQMARSFTNAHVLKARSRLKARGYGLPDPSA